MTKEEKEAAKAVKEEEKVADPRQALWEVFLEKHKAQNPIKHAARLAAGELNEIPANFKG